MDVSSRGLPPLVMDLSKGYSLRRLTCSHTQAMDITKKPEWYHRQSPNCSSNLASPYRTRSRSMSTSYSSLHPDSSVRCRDLDQGRDTLGNYMNSGLAPALDLYRDQVQSNLWHPGFYDQSGEAGPESSGGEEEEEEEDSDSDSDVIFLVSSAKEPLLCTSFIQDNVTHIVEPLSPAASSLDEGRSCYHLPQPVSSPSPDSSYTDESSDSSVDITMHHARPIVLLTDLGAVYTNQSPVEASSDDSDIIEISVSNKKKLCKKSSQREAEKEPSPKVRRGSRIRKTSCNTTPTLTPRRSLKRQVKNSAVGIYNESYDSDDVLDFVARASSSDESISQPSVSKRMCSKADVDATRREKSPSPEREERSQCESVYAKDVGNKRKKAPTIIKAKKLSLAKQNCQEPKEKAEGEQKKENKKNISKRKRKRRFKQNGPSSLFSPIEPEIALKFARWKKKDRKMESFSPFVHIEKQTCTVVNYREEDETSAASRAAQAQNMSGFVPTTSCYNLGRVSSESKSGEFLKCCLCGHTANAKSLGDLHGPYYPAFTEGQDSRTVQNGLPESHSAEEGGELQSKSVLDDSSPPTLPPLNLEECWIHGDCGVWSAGVFLVRGKLYGLKEAALLAQQTICSSCQETGAIMGCFLKGCCRNFHYTCAIQSGCVLNEDNFSMRCPDHKNKACVSRQHLR